MKTQEKEYDIIDLYDLLLEQIRDLYDGERQQLNFMLEALEMASTPELEEMIQLHRRETKRQLSRLEKAFEILREKPTGEHCEGIKGLITEAYKLSERCKTNETRDAALITAIQHINHYEMAGYGTAIAYAKTLEQHDVAEQLLETLREEKSADLGLSDLAEDRINPDARWTSLVEKIERGERTPQP